MIKDVFVLRKNSWHMKLMKWIWNLDYRDFSHICPYFWMSVLNIIIVVPVATVRGLVWLAGMMFGWLFEAVDKFIEARGERWLLDLQNDPDYTIERVSRLCDKDYNKWQDTVLFSGKFKDLNARNEYWAKLQEARSEFKNEKYMRKQREELIDASASIKRKQHIATIVKYVKPVAVTIGWGIMLVLAMAILFLLWKLIVLIASVPAKSWKIFGYVVIGIFVGGGLIIGLFLFLKWLITRAACAMPSETPGWVKAIGIPIKWLFSGIATVWDIITTMASNSCPFIDWED